MYVCIILSQLPRTANASGRHSFSVHWGQETELVHWCILNISSRIVWITVIRPFCYRFDSHLLCQSIVQWLSQHTQPWDDAVNDSRFHENNLSAPILFVPFRCFLDTVDDWRIWRSASCFVNHTTAGERKLFFFVLTAFIDRRYAVDSGYETVDSFNSFSGAAVASWKLYLYRPISMASRINIYSQLVMSTSRIADITNSNCWYQQFELLISTIRIADINNSH